MLLVLRKICAQMEIFFSFQISFWAQRNNSKIEYRETGINVIYVKNLNFQEKRK